MSFADKTVSQRRSSLWIACHTSPVPKYVEPPLRSCPEPAPELRGRRKNQDRCRRLQPPEGKTTAQALQIALMLPKRWPRIKRKELIELAGLKIPGNWPLEFPEEGQHDDFPMVAGKFPTLRLPRSHRNAYLLC